MSRPTRSARRSTPRSHLPAPALALALVVPCLLPWPARARADRSVLVSGVPHVRQQPDFCGEACAEMWLRKLGRGERQGDVFAATGVDPALGRGAYTAELARGLGRLGFDPGPVWHHVTAGDDDAIASQWEALVADLRRGIPSIICTHYDESPGTTEHFRLVLGWDARTDEVIYHEPAEDRGAFRRMPRSRMLALWPLKYDRTRWTLIRLRLAGGESPASPPAINASASASAAPAPASRPTPAAMPPATTGAPTNARTFTAADFAQHVMKLRERLPRGFSVVVEPPFVVVGDESPELVQRRATQTVRWAVQRLKRAYFDRDPRRIIDVWLFRDRASYQRNLAALFDEHPDTPYGYYSPRHHALFMNIGTGGGTLVHEMVHPFVDAATDDCPPWINEGLASLYEQSSDDDGEIKGLTNWRLPDLQQAIRAGKVPTFQWLASRDTEAFYERDPGTNYSQSRYLFYYLQEKGLIRRFWREMLAHRKDDPTGYATLVRVLGEKDMRDFQRRWERFVLTLRFDG